MKPQVQNGHDNVQKLDWIIIAISVILIRRVDKFDKTLKVDQYQIHSFIGKEGKKKKHLYHPELTPTNLLGSQINN